MFRKKKTALALAETLIKFVNLEDSGVEDFRAANQTFAPDAWWDLRRISKEGYTEAWKETQAALRNAFDIWVTGDRLSYQRLNLLCSGVFAPSELSQQVADPRELDVKWGFHKAVFFINSDPSWRVKVCKCGKRYIADHPRRVYCADSVTCPAFAKMMEKRIIAERKKKLNWWNKHRAKKAKSRRRSK